MRCGPTIWFVSDEIKQPKCVFCQPFIFICLFHMLTPFPTEAITVAAAEQGEDSEYVRELADSGIYLSPEALALYVRTLL